MAIAYAIATHAPAEKTCWMTRSQSCSRIQWMPKIIIVTVIVSRVMIIRGVMTADLKENIIHLKKFFLRRYVKNYPNGMIVLWFHHHPN